MWTWAVGFNHPARATYHGSGNMGCWTIKDLYTVNHKEDKGHSQSSAHVNLQRLWASWRRRWHPTPVLLPGKSHGRRSLVGCSPWGRSESDITERLHFHALEKEMTTHSSVLAWRIPGTEAWWEAIYGVAQSWTRLKRLSSSSSSSSSSSRI